MAIVYPLWSVWNSVPSEKTYYYNKGGAYPTPEKVDLIVANFTDPSLPGFSEFRMTGIMPANNPAYNPALYANFINPSSYTGKGYPISGAWYITLENNTHFEFTPIFQNLENLPVGEYWSIHYFRVDGKKTSDGNWQYYLGEKEFFTKIIVTDADYDYSTDNLLTNPYPVNEVAFTLENKAFQINSTNVGTYFQFDAAIKTSEFYTDNEHQYLLPQKVITFQGKSKVWLNKSIHKLMKKFNEINDIQNQYNLASLEITCSEYEIVSNNLIRTITTPIINFIAGLKKDVVNIGFLDFNPLPNRVTINSFSYLNVLIPNQNYEIRINKNGAYQSTIYFEPIIGKVVTKKVSFENYKQGDVIEFILWDLQNDIAIPKTKIYVVLPEGDFSNMILWENEFLLKSAIECTGTAILGGDIEFNSFKTIENNIEVTNYLSTSKEPKLNINTGWLIYTDIDTIDSLMRSKRAWFIKDNRLISLRPTGKKLPEKNLNQELISFPLEFTINKSYDEETYSF